ncbi:SIR2 family NAD-dependent protein deacylase [Vibrio fortis]|uniref:SIR2 family NAD-dependent protein deacylase n=1 Tax=Vibrio fortis TaxID=212667 RepID=UPI004068FC5A
MNELNVKNKKVLFITGAGVSVDSGIPDFYSKNGLYKVNEKTGLSPIGALNAKTLKTKPQLVWQTVHELFSSIGDVKPNKSHVAISAMSELASEVIVLTQNVDGLHSVTGKEKVYEVHGNALNSKCLRCDTNFNDHFEQLSKRVIPRCDLCGGMLRLDIVLFDEMPKLPEDINDICSNVDYVFFVGTGSPQHYLINLAAMCLQGGAKIHWVNPRPISEHADLSMMLECFGLPSELITEHLLDSSDFLPVLLK